MTSRRLLIRQGAALAAGALLLSRAASAQPSWPRSAFEARNLADALKALGVAPVAASGDVLLQTPDLAEDGSVVPMSMSASAPGVRQMALLVERNPAPLAALFTLSEAVEPQLSLRLKVQESTRVLALALLADGRALEASRELRVTAGGCVGGGDPEAVSNPAAGPTKMRTQLVPGRGVVVRALLTHEMESGQRSDAQGRPIPAWHITEVNVRLNGQPVLSAWWGPSIARNPFLQFTLKSARPGDRLAIAWVDNRGGRRNDETTVG